MSLRKWRWALSGIAAVAGLAAAIIAFESRDEAGESEQMATAIKAFTAAGNRMTPAEVRRSFGEPDQVFRNNPRALCWAYSRPYKVRMCWGPKRQAAWISYSIPRPGIGPPAP